VDLVTLVFTEVENDAKGESPSIVGLPKKIGTKVVELERADGDAIIQRDIHSASHR